MRRERNRKFLKLYLWLIALIVLRRLRFDWWQEWEVKLWSGETLGAFGDYHGR